jgi:hypothetical protein
MTKGAMRWVVGLLAGGALAMAGCQGGEGDAADREGRAFETPQHREDRPKKQDEAEPLGASNEHPATKDQESPAGQLAEDTPLGGGTAGPNTGKRAEATGTVSGAVAEGLGTSLADAYQAPQPQGGTAMGGSGAAGAEGNAPPGGSTQGSATPGTQTSGGAGSAGGGNMGGQQGRK